MPDPDGSTCLTCLTLNPPAAPACVRCNTPLPGTGTSTGPIDAVPARSGAGPRPADPGVPGSSRAHAAAVQPPGYGPAEEDPLPAAPAPEPDTALARRVTVAGLVLVGLVLAVGGGAMWLTRSDYLDSRDVETAVAAELSARGGGAVTVSCPGDPRHRSGETFDCVASDTAGGRRTLAVTVLDDAGRYRWNLNP